MRQEVNQGSNEESKDAANQSKNTLNLGYKPNYGTKCMNVVHPAPLGHQNPKTMKEAHDEYKKFKELKRKDDMSGGQDAGTAAYLISKKWLKKYERFILADKFDYGYSEGRGAVQDDHWVTNHPGPISNEDLLEDDENKRNLYGTSTLPNQDKDYLD